MEQQGHIALAVDSLILCETVLSLRGGELAQRNEPVRPITVEPVGGSFRIWFGLAMNTDSMACRPLADSVDHGFYLERYGVSRQRSPFNDRLYARRNFEGALVSHVGSTRFAKTAAGVEAAEISEADLTAALVRELGSSWVVVSESVAPHGVANEFPITPSQSTSQGARDNAGERWFHSL